MILAMYSSVRYPPGLVCQGCARSVPHWATPTPMASTMIPKELFYSTREISALNQGRSLSNWLRIASNLLHFIDHGPVFGCWLLRFG